MSESLDRPRGGWAGIYCRISDDREGAGLGVARQEQDCRPICHRHGYPDERIRVYADNDRSAYSGKPRPEYAQLLADIRSGEVTFLTAWHNDRLHRSPLELEEFITVIEAAGLAIEIARAGGLDLQTPSGRMVARQLGAVARYESEHKAERQRRKCLELAELGRSNGGGRRPFGYQSDRRTLDPTEAGHVRDAARRVLAGESIRSVCRDLTARGIDTVGGGSWHPTVMRDLLVSARIGGRREYQRRGHGRRTLGAIVCPRAEWEAIISPEESDALRVLLSDPRRRRNPPWTHRTYLLRGLARCGLCHRTLVARPRAGGRRFYVCASGPGFGGCGRIRVAADELEQDVVERLILAIDEGALEALLRESDDGDAAAARDEAIHLEERLNAVAEMFATDAISRSEWQAMRQVLQRRFDAAQRRYDALRCRRSMSTLPRPLRAAWETFGFAERRSTVTDFIATVHVQRPVRPRMRNYDPSRVQVEWKV